MFVSIFRFYAFCCVFFFTVLLIDVIIVPVFSDRWLFACETGDKHGKWHGMALNEILSLIPSGSCNGVIDREWI